MQVMMQRWRTLTNLLLHEAQASPNDQAQTSTQQHPEQPVFFWTSTSNRRPSTSACPQPTAQPHMSPYQYSAS